MSMNGHLNSVLRGGSGGTTELSYSLCNPPSKNVNLPSSADAPWSQNNVNGSAVCGAEKVPTPPKDVKVESSPVNSNQSGTTLKEHDLLGMSDVSSTSARGSSAPESLHEEGHEFEELNLKMELGPPAARKRWDDVQSSAAVENGDLCSSEPDEQPMIAGDMSSAGSEANGSVSDQSDHGPAFGSQAQSGKAELADMSKCNEREVGLKTSSEGLRFGISTPQCQRAGTQDCLDEVPERDRPQERSIAPPELQLTKQHMMYQVAEVRSATDWKCPPPLQPTGCQGFQPTSERSPRLPETPNRLWPNSMAKFRNENIGATPGPYHQQLSIQQDLESRPAYPVSAASFAGNRNLYSAPKLGVSGAKRTYESMGGPDTRMSSEGRSGHSGPPSVATPSEMDSRASSQLKSQSSVHLYQWGHKPNLSAPSWHIGLEPSGGSFGPFPSSQRPVSGSSVAKNVGDGGGLDAKVWDGQTKVLQDKPTVTIGKAGGPTDVKKPANEVSASLKAETSGASTPRAAPAAVGWPPLASFRKNFAVVPRPGPSETPTPRQPPPSPSPATAGQSNGQSWFVKVNMDGYPVGRKVDLRINSSYEKLSQALDEMFRPQFETFLSGQSGPNRIVLPSDMKRNFLQGPDLVLTYEDQDGDLMLVGDVPWTMFIDTVKRLRIMKGSEAIGLGNRVAEKGSKTTQAKV